MAAMTIELDEALVDVLDLLGQPPQQLARELMVIELYRRDVISSGKAAELLGMDRLAFIQYAGDLGIPLIRYAEGELAAEMAQFTEA